MRFLLVMLPVIAAIGLGVVITAWHRRLPPVLATRAIVVSLTSVAGAVVATLWAIVVGYVAHLPVLDGRFDWCAEALGVHGRIPAWVGLPAALLTTIGAARALRVLRSYRRLREHDSTGIEIATHEQPFAFTMPGAGGNVVLSSGLVAMLSDAEKEVVLAHESAHATKRHDRILLTAQLASAAVPPLRPLTSRLRFCLERCADEFAVAQCGDRGLVARTLGKVAMRTSTMGPALGFGGSGVPARVAALLSPPTAGLRASARAALWGALTVMGVLAIFQIHHIAALIIALCEG